LEIVAGGKDIEMTLIYCSVQGVNYAAAAFALVAAVLWFVSASVKTPSSFDINFEISCRVMTARREGPATALA
jgi:hypothetical protein